MREKEKEAEIERKGAYIDKERKPRLKERPRECKREPR